MKTQLGSQLTQCPLAETPSSSVEASLHCEKQSIQIDQRMLAIQRSEHCNPDDNHQCSQLHLMGWWDTCGGGVQTALDDARRPAHSGFQTTIPHILPQISDTFTPLICHLGSCGCLGARPQTPQLGYDTPRGSEDPKRA